jgi:hypothetical protein
MLPAAAAVFGVPYTPGQRRNLAEGTGELSCWLNHDRPGAITGSVQSLRLPTGFFPRLWAASRSTRRSPQRSRWRWLPAAVVERQLGGGPLHVPLDKGRHATIDRQGGLRQPSAQYRRVVFPNIRCSSSARLTPCARGLLVRGSLTAKNSTQDGGLSRFHRLSSNGPAAEARTSPCSASNARPLSVAAAGGCSHYRVKTYVARRPVADQKQPRPRRRADRDHTASPKMGKGADRATIRPEPAYRFK